MTEESKKVQVEASKTNGPWTQRFLDENLMDVEGGWASLANLVVAFMCEFEKDLVPKQTISQKLYIKD